MARSQKTVKDKLDKALNVANTSLEKSGKEVIQLLPPATGALEKPSRPEDFTPQCQEDYEYARATYYQLIEKGQEAIDGALELAQEGESPRAYEVVGLVIKAVCDVNTALMTLQEKMKNLRGLKETENADKGNQAVAGDTYVFAGSTAEVMKIIAEAKKNKG